MKKELTVYRTSAINGHMKRTTHDKFSPEHQEAATFAKVLSHPARIIILEMLAEQAACICGDMVNRLPMAQSTVSQHLKELKNAGLISGEIDGPRVCYCLNREKYTLMKKVLESTLSGINQKIKEGPHDCCT